MSEKVYTARCKDTNADRIRGMSDEELAEWLFRQTRIAQDIPPNFEKPVVDEWIKWLKRPIAEEGNKTLDKQK